MTSRYDPDRDDLAALLADQPRYRVDQVWDGLYRQLVPIEELTTLPKSLRTDLAAVLPSALTPIAESVSHDESTVKVLWQLDGGARVESVLMHYDDRSTICVSSQAGCAMACGFCATGQAGFERHLEVGEIVEQVARLAARSRASGRRVSNVVFMGMGEPFVNYDRVWTAVERLHDDMGLSARHLTLSTVGIIPGIRRLATERLPVNLAVSLHAADDRLRTRLVPINARYPIAELLDACADYVRQRNRRVSFEWALIDGVNDTDVQASRLAALCKALPLAAHVNLIPLNPTPGYATRGSSMTVVRGFRDRLTSLGVNATIRRNRGTEIDAACGQLAAGHAATPVSLRSRRSVEA